MSQQHKVIGYFAYASSHDVFCDADACIIAGSEEKMKEYLARMNSKAISAFTIKKTRFEEIMKGFLLGGAYGFDKEAYDRFYPLAKEEGLPVEPHDFSKKTPTGMNFIVIKKMG